MSVNISWSLSIKAPRFVNWASILLQNPIVVDKAIFSYGSIVILKIALESKVAKLASGIAIKKGRPKVEKVEAVTVKEN